MGEVKVDESVKPGQKVDLEAERKKREQAPKARQRATATPRRAADTTALEGKLKDFYGTVVGAMYFLDSDVADFQAKHVDRMAVTQAAWARDNAFVRRFLETLTTGGVAAAAIGEAVIVAGGTLMIVQAKRGQLDPRYMPAAAFFGVDLPAPVRLAEEPEPERQDYAGDFRDNGGGLEGVKLGDEDETQSESV